MKALLRVGGVVVLSLAIIAGVVFGLGERETLVAPPEVVAENFVVALAHGRAGPARDLLARDAAQSASIASLLDSSRRFRARIGNLEGVKATVRSRRPNTAIVRADIEGRRAQVALLLPLVRENGVWKVEGLGDALGSIARLPVRGGTS